MTVMEGRVLVAQNDSRGTEGHFSLSADEQQSLRAQLRSLLARTVEGTAPRGSKSPTCATHARGHRVVIRVGIPKLRHHDEHEQQ
jgi:hypothetical protein